MARVWTKLAIVIALFMWSAVAVKAAPLALKAMCDRLCGGVWRVVMRGPDGSVMNVSFVYELDESGQVLQGRGYFTPPNGQGWIDRHYYMADAAAGRFQYVGISPRAGMTSGQGRLEKSGYTALVSSLARPLQFARIVNEFPAADTHKITIFQSEDGFRAPAAPIVLMRTKE